MNKFCKNCNTEKPIENFSKHCRSKDGFANDCKVCSEAYQKVYRKINADKNREYKKQYQILNKERLNKISNDYTNANKERIREYKKNYNERRKVLRSERMKTDSFYKVATYLRNGVGRAFRLKGWGKQGHSKELLGCDYETAKKHIESKFLEGMNWDNYGKFGWHVDHALPLASAKNINELRKLCHYTNLQPLWWRDNIIKGDKILYSDLNIAI